MPSYSSPESIHPAPNPAATVVFVLPHLGPGGAQRVACNVANGLAQHGHSVHIVTTLTQPADAFELDPRVGRPSVSRSPRAKERRVQPIRDASKSTGVVALGPIAAVHSVVVTVSKILRLRRIIRAVKPDCVVAFLTKTNIMTIAATHRLGTRTVVSERNDPLLQRQGRLIDRLRRHVYPRADLVTANTRGALEYLRTFVPEPKLAFLPNPVVVGSHEGVVTFDEPTIVTVGRLVEQKGIDVLLEAAAVAFAMLPRWRLVVVGDGPLRAELSELAEAKGIASRVDWIGHVADPFPYLRGARFFVLPSRFEGSPNALLEAMSCGLPAIVNDASPGPLELIENGKTGLVVPAGDAGRMAEAIVMLARDDALMADMSAAARLRIAPHLSETAMQAWIRCIDAARS